MVHSDPVWYNQAAMAPRSRQQWHLVGADHPPTCKHGQPQKSAQSRDQCLNWHCMREANTAWICSSSLADHSLGSLSEGYTCPKSFGSLTQPHSQTPEMLPYSLFVFIFLCRSPSLYPVIGSGPFFYCFLLLASQAHSLIAKIIHTHM